MISKQHHLVLMPAFIALVGSVLFYLAPPVKAAAMFQPCSTISECIQNSTLPCQEWIDSMESWVGDCCSLQDINDGSDIACQLTIVGSCTMTAPNPPLDCQVDPVTNETIACAGLPGSQQSFEVEEKGECPSSKYDPFAKNSLSVTSTDAVVDVNTTVGEAMNVTLDPNSDLVTTDSPPKDKGTTQEPVHDLDHNTTEAKADNSTSTIPSSAFFFVTTTHWTVATTAGFLSFMLLSM